MARISGERGAGRETCDTVVKSALTGVGAMAFVAFAFSPVGFDGLIGTSLASALGGAHATSNSYDPFAKLPPFPSLMSQAEIDHIDGQLAAAVAAMEVTRAATDDQIELIRELAKHGQALSIGRTAPHRQN